MKKNLYWRIFLNTPKKEKAEKLSANIKEDLGGGDIRVLEPYWKDKSLHCLEISQEFEFSGQQEAVFALLKILPRVSSSWHLQLPADPEAEEEEISGAASTHLRWNWVTWASFSFHKEDVG